MSVYSQDTSIVYDANYSDGTNSGVISLTLPIQGDSGLTESDLDDIARGAISVISSKFSTVAVVRTLKTSNINSSWS